MHKHTHTLLYIYIFTNIQDGPPRIPRGNQVLNQHSNQRDNLQNNRLAAPLHNRLISRLINHDQNLRDTQQGSQLVNRRDNRHRVLHLIPRHIHHRDQTAPLRYVPQPLPLILQRGLLPGQRRDQRLFLLLCLVHHRRKTPRQFQLVLLLLRHLRR